MIKSKIMTVGRMQRMFKAVREAHEAHVQLKGLTPGDRIDVQRLREQNPTGFKAMKKFDQVNEMMPDNLGKPQTAPVVESDGEEEMLSQLHGSAGAAVDYSKHSV